jgi:hypothetical protein
MSDPGAASEAGQPVAPHPDLRAFDVLVRAWTLSGDTSLVDGGYRSTATRVRGPRSGR